MGKSLKKADITGIIGIVSHETMPNSCLTTVTMDSLVALCFT